MQVAPCQNLILVMEYIQLTAGLKALTGKRQVEKKVFELFKTGYKHKILIGNRQYQREIEQVEGLHKKVFVYYDYYTVCSQVVDRK